MPRACLKKPTQANASEARRARNRITPSGAAAGSARAISPRAISGAGQASHVAGLAGLGLGRLLTKSAEQGGAYFSSGKHDQWSRRNSRSRWSLEHLTPSQPSQHPFLPKWTKCTWAGHGMLKDTVIKGFEWCLRPDRIFQQASSLGAADGHAVEELNMVLAMEWYLQLLLH